MKSLPQFQPICIAFWKWEKQSAPFPSVKGVLLRIISPKMWVSGAYPLPTLPKSSCGHFPVSKKPLRGFLSRDIQFKHMHCVRYQGNQASGCWKPTLGILAPHGLVDALATVRSSRQHPAAAPGGISSPPRWLRDKADREVREMPGLWIRLYDPR